MVSNGNHRKSAGKLLYFRKEDELNFVEPKVTLHSAYCSSHYSQLTTFKLYFPELTSYPFLPINTNKSFVFFKNAIIF